MTTRLQPPEGLPDYLEPIKCLGEGGMGSVWSVKDLRTNKIGALKAIRPGLLTEQPIVRRFEREMRTVAQLNHPYIVQILDVGRLLTGAPYMLMEQIDGVPLIDLSLCGRSLGELIRLFDRILSALAYAHARRIVHRDLKPDNVLVYTDEVGELIPKLMDFGLAMVAAVGKQSTRLTADGMVVGTPAYMAAEQACDEQHKICAATDLYAFGVMLYELLCGSSPHIAASPMALLLAHATKPPRPFVPLPEIPSAKRLEPLIMRLLEKDPLDRFEFASDVRAELRNTGLLASDEDVESDQLGSYGDTILGMEIPPELPRQRSLEEKAQDEAFQQVTGSGVFAVPTEKMFQVSVMNLREPPFVGRDEARNTLQRYLEDVRTAGQSALCLVSGPTGIGKSRLIRCLCEDGEARGGLRYLRVNVGAGANASLSVILAIIDHLRLTRLSQSQSESALMRFFRTEDMEDWRVVGFLSLMAKQDGSSSSLGATMGRIELLIYAAVQQLSFGRPLVLWLDDTQGVDNKHIQKLLRAICARQRTDPAAIFVVIVDRAEIDVPSDLELAIGNLDNAWLRKGVHLPSLSSVEALALTRDGLGLSPDLAAHVARLSNGLPLLAVALARQWHAAGLLQSTPDGFAPTTELSTLPVPEEVHKVLLGQLEVAFVGMEPALWRPIAELAAVIGRTFTLGLLKDALPRLPKRTSTIDVESFIERVLSDGIVKTTSEGHFEFTSGLIRDGILGTTSPDRMSDLHRAAARAKKKFALRRPGVYLEIAQHLLAGRTYDEAYDAFLTAARVAMSYGQDVDAQGFLESAQQAIALQDGVSGPWDPRVATVWEIELQIALRHGNLETADERKAWLEHAASRIGDPIWLAKVPLNASRILRVKGNSDEAQAAMLEARTQLEGLPQSPERDRCLVETLICCSATEEHLTNAIELSRELKDNPLLARSLLASGRQLLKQDAKKTARNHLAESLAIAREIGEMAVEGEALILLAELTWEQDELFQAEKLLNKARRCFEALGDFDIVAQCHERLADIAKRQGRRQDADMHRRWLDLIKPD